MITTTELLTYLLVAGFLLLTISTTLLISIRRIKFLDGEEFIFAFGFLLGVIGTVSGLFLTVYSFWKML